MPAWLKPAQRQAVLSALGDRYGGRGSGLDHRNPFELLVAVILSAQSTDKMVNTVTPALFAAFPTPQAMGALEWEQLRPYIAKIGLTNNKAKHLVATCRLLVERHGGEVPRTLEALMALPGVGRKTANVVLSNAFGVAAIPVDTHVFRVSNRLGLADADSVAATERDLQQTVPEALWSEAHHWLIWHGREVCKAPTPRCEACFLTQSCHYFNGRGRWKGRKAGATDARA